MKKNTVVMAVILLAVLMTVIPTLADAPGNGTVVEGVSVPGIALGNTRDVVEDSVGPPSSCRSNNDPPTLESCSFAVAGGGWVSVFYQGSDGGDATGSEGDIVSNIRWGGEEVEDWITTAGINAKMAKYNKQAAIDAYPNGDLYYDSVGRLYRLNDPELGIRINWNHAYIFYTVSMEIFNPYTPPPPPDPIRVADIQMSYDRQSVTADVLILDEQDQPVEDAVVGVFWVYPLNKNNNTNMFVDGTTGEDGYATFKIGNKARPGDYRITITNVSKEDFKWDDDGSILVGTITKPK